MISVGIIGGTGYTGKHLLEYCSNHPYIENLTVYAKNSAGESLLSIFPELDGIVENQVVKSVDNISTGHDVYFVSLPHGESLKYVPWLYELNKVIIDLGGDYRLKEPALYDKWYKFPHSSTHLLQRAHYGLAEFNSNRENIKLVANPGCYPTSALLALKPLVKEFSTAINTITINSYSGTSGAGKSPKTELMMAEMDGNVAAYKVNGHQHFPEIEQELISDGLKSPVAFTTHLLPVARGIYSTSTVHLSKELDPDEILNVYRKTYDGQCFVRLRDIPPKLAWVTGTNFCDINVSVSGKTVIITSAIDNLIKGASGQAVQNMNFVFGWEDGLGILKNSNYEKMNSEV